jgi:outer membrane protein OmpA-like peptidoglycan-associated protein
VDRVAKTVNYRHRGGATTIDFEGTLLQPKANGEAKVESKQGYIEIEVEFDDLTAANQYGPEYLTYVMWAITPEGRANNLGEVLLNGNRSKLNVTTELQAFALVVTAEPYFGVTQPSDVVVMENVIRPDTRGKIESLDAKYELLKRGTYALNVEPGSLQRVLDPKVPLELYEARNAVTLARAARADRYSADTFQKAATLLQQAEDYQARKAGKQAVIMAARQAVQTAEDSRLISIQRMEEERKENEHRAMQAREAAAQQSADDEARRRAAAEADRQRAEAEQRRAEIAAAAAREQQRAAEAAAERARREANEATLRARQEADRIRSEAEREKAELRAQLREQLNAIMETTESARGLIVNMSDVLFDTAQHTLKPGAREKLAKVSGIVLSHPGLTLEVEGHTDSVGGDEYNQGLSERRSNSVRDYLAQQGLSPNLIAARGFGESRPVASNDNAAGRQQNRRVEIIVAGEPIGISTGSARSSLR